MFMSCLGYSIGTSKLHPKMISSANLTTFIWFWAQWCADTQRTSPSSSFEKDSPQQTLLPSHRPTSLQLPTNLLFTSISLRFPSVSRQCISFTHPSNSWHKPSKVFLGYLKNSCTAIWSSSHFKIQRVYQLMHIPMQLQKLLHFGCAFLMHVIAMYSRLKLFSRYGIYISNLRDNSSVSKELALQWKMTELLKYFSCSRIRAQLLQVAYDK